MERIKYRYLKIVVSKYSIEVNVYVLLDIIRSFMLMHKKVTVCRKEKKLWSTNFQDKKFSNHYFS